MRRGFRYRLHKPDLRGKPDLVFPNYKAIILVSGCFWHQHDGHLFKCIAGSDKIGVASNDTDFVINADGSVSIHWSIHCDDTDYTNCMPITAGEEWFSLFRMYGPSETWFEFVPPSIERIEN